MFFRKKKSGKYEYLQIAEGLRDGGKVRQRVLLTLGTCTEWIAGGKLDSLLVSGKQVIFRSEMKGCADNVLRATGVAAPSAIRFK